MPRDAFHGQYEQIVCRASGLEGKDALIAILTENPQLAFEYSKIQRLQGKRDGMASEQVEESDEIRGVIDMLGKFACQLDIMRDGSFIETRSRFSRLVQQIANGSTKEVLC